jgi:hypothetical protein
MVLAQYGSPDDSVTSSAVLGSCDRDVDDEERSMGIRGYKYTCIS